MCSVNEEIKILTRDSISKASIIPSIGEKNFRSSLLQQSPDTAQTGIFTKGVGHKPGKNTVNFVDPGNINLLLCRLTNNRTIKTLFPGEGIRQGLYRNDMWEQQKIGSSVPPTHFVFLDMTAFKHSP